MLPRWPLAILVNEDPSQGRPYDGNAACMSTESADGLSVMFLSRERTICSNSPGGCAVQTKKGKLGTALLCMTEQQQNRDAAEQQSHDAAPIMSAENTHITQPEPIPRTLILSILATGIMAFIGILTETLMNVLFPILMGEFHISTSTVQWLTTGYLLVVSLVVPLSSYLKRKLPVKRIFLIAIVLCIVGCIVGACTLNFPMLMLARILQGGGTGIALPLMFNIILDQAPKSRIGQLMGVGSLVVATAPALGPTVGGLVGTYMPWRWIFVILLPFLLIALGLGLANIQQGSPTVDAHLNPLHVLLMAVGFVAFVFAIDGGGSAITAFSQGASGAGKTAVLAVVLLIVSVVALVAFAQLSRRSFSPLVRLGVLRSVPFRWHLLAYVLLQISMIGFSFVIPNSAQLGYGISALVSGVLVLPGALFGAMLAPVSGSLLDRQGPVKPISAALTVTLIGVLLFSVFVNGSSTAVELGIFYFVFMVGFSMAFANTMTSGLNQVDAQLKADGNALFSTFQQLAGAVSTTILSVFLASAQAGHGEPGTATYRAATVVGAHNGYIFLTIVVICACLCMVHAFGYMKREGALS